MTTQRHERFVLTLALAAAQTAFAQSTARGGASSIPPARFEDPGRAQKLGAAFPEVDRAFEDFAKRSNVPGIAWGVIVDGALVHSGAWGVRDTKTQAPVQVDSMFRIASMTKSFTALAIMKLRDAGKLELDAPAARYVPALSGLKYPTADSPQITVRHLLSHAEGFPEDNPWGDRQLARSDAALLEWVRGGIPFSTAPGTAYEYSNYGFALLGQIVARLSGVPTRDFIDREILKPLGMTSTKWEASSFEARVAKGYGFGNSTWVEEPPLADGSFGAMGGLYSTVPDLARYVAFYLSAYPPRDDSESGPVKRASAREMQTPVTPYRSIATRSAIDGPLTMTSGGYAFGLGVRQNCLFSHDVSHGGGLPGYGSQMRWLPEYGVGIVALANRTYAGPSSAVQASFEALSRTGALKPRVPQPSEALLRAQRDVSALVETWSDEGLRRLAADNLLLDRSAQIRRDEFATLRKTHGTCDALRAAPITAENALRGGWEIPCERGRVRVDITLAPTMPPLVQYLETRSLLDLTGAVDTAARDVEKWIANGTAPRLAMNADARGKATQQVDAARAWGTCERTSSAATGDTGFTLSLKCQKGDLTVRGSIDAAGALDALSVAPAPGTVCVP